MRNLKNKTEFCFLGGKIFMIFGISWDISGENLEDHGVNGDYGLLHFGKHDTKTKKKKAPMNSYSYF